MPAWLVALIVALIAATPGLLAWQAAGRANRTADQEKETRRDLESRKVDQAAFETAQGIYERGIAEVNRQLQRCQEDLAIERHETRRLRTRVAKLERVIAQAGLPVPNGIGEEG